jgi:hypothetical protein
MDELNSCLFAGIVVSLYVTYIHCLIYIIALYNKLYVF